MTQRRLVHTSHTPTTTEETLETAILDLARLRLVEQQVWLDELPYQDAEHRAIVRQSHEALSEEARAVIGLVLHYPDVVVEEINKTPAPNNYYVRHTYQARAYNTGRVVRYLQRERGVPARVARGVYLELKEFVHTLSKYTRGRDYNGVSVSKVLEQKKHIKNIGGVV